MSDPEMNEETSPTTADAVIEKPRPLTRLGSVGQSQGLLSSLLAFMVNDENTHANLVTAGQRARSEYIETEKSGG